MRSILVVIRERFVSSLEPLALEAFLTALRALDSIAIFIVGVLIVVVVIVVVLVATCVVIVVVGFVEQIFVRWHTLLLHVDFRRQDEHADLFGIVDVAMLDRTEAVQDEQGQAGVVLPVVDRVQREKIVQVKRRATVDQQDRLDSTVDVLNVTVFEIVLVQNGQTCVGDVLALEEVLEDFPSAQTVDVEMNEDEQPALLFGDVFEEFTLEIAHEHHRSLCVYEISSSCIVQHDPVSIGQSS